MGDLARTPIYEEHLALGARMVEFAGYEMPVQYEGIIDEHRAVRERAGVFDVSHMATLRLGGSGAAGVLQSLLTNDVGSVSEIGRAQYTLMCDDEGGIYDDLIVYHTGDGEYLVIANAGNRETVVGRLLEALPDGVEFSDETERTALLALQGPLAVGIAEQLAGAGWVVPKRFHISEARLDTVPALVMRTGYTGEDGVEIVCRAGDAAGLWRAILSFPEVSPCGIGARDTLRLEMGYALHGAELGRDSDPVSAGLMWVVAMDKGAFCGRDAIARIQASGPAKRLVGLSVGDGIPRAGFPVLHDGHEVGSVASGTFAPTLGHGIATAYLPADIAVEGTQLELMIRRRVVPAKVVKPPFVSDTSLGRKD